MVEGDSSKGSEEEEWRGVQKKRSSSERKDVGRAEEELLESDSPRDERRGHEGKAHVASWARRLEGVMSMGIEEALDMELYDPYEPYMAGCVYRPRDFVV